MAHSSVVADVSLPAIKTFCSDQEKKIEHVKIKLSEIERPLVVDTKYNERELINLILQK